MPLWEFFGYRTAAGRSPLDDWYEQLPRKAQTKFDARLLELGTWPRHRWVRPYAHHLAGDQYHGIYEVRFEVFNVVHRPLGYFGPGTGRFTFLIGATERGGDFDPRNAPDTAVENRRIINADPSRIVECEFG